MKNIIKKNRLFHYLFNNNYKYISSNPHRLITSNKNYRKLLKWQIWKNQRNKFKQEIIKVLHNFSESNSNINSNIIEFLFEKDILDQFFIYED